MAGRGRGRGRGRGGAMPDVIANTLRELGRTSIGDKNGVAAPLFPVMKLPAFEWGEDDATVIGHQRAIVSAMKASAFYVAPKKANTGIVRYSDEMDKKSATSVAAHLGSQLSTPQYPRELADLLIKAAAAADAADIRPTKLARRDSIDDRFGHWEAKEQEGQQAGEQGVEGAEEPALLKNRSSSFGSYAAPDDDEIEGDYAEHYVDDDSDGAGGEDSGADEPTL